MKIIDIIQILKEYHAPVDEEHTSDVVKFGNPDQECTGVITTVCATVEVIRKAAAVGANLIIVHEPLFYSDKDDQEWLKGSPVYEEKVRLLTEAHIVVWRDHDRLHGGSPAREDREYMDLVFYGIMKELGWEEYCVGFHNKPLLYQVPETTAEVLAAELTAKLGLSGARIVGNPNARIRKVFFCEHVTEMNHGGRDADREAILEIENGDFNAMIPFEIIDWTLSAYVRDAAQLGSDKVIIEMGHFNVEESAMKYMAKWLPELLGFNVPVQFVQAGDSFTYFVSESNT